jgi:hypothetical protein
MIGDLLAELLSALVPRKVEKALLILLLTGVGAFVLWYLFLVPAPVD